MASRSVRFPLTTPLHPRATVVTPRSSCDGSRRLNALSQASLPRTTELSLGRMLRQIAEMARDMRQGRYAALGVINESGTVGLRGRLAELAMKPRSRTPTRPGAPEPSPIPT